ncbi:MAG: hypothetical protein IJ795_08065 [Bacteroidales bacterium]|nr:hypothetical protein [Bacteroidales bacterium]
MRRFLITLLASVLVCAPAFAQVGVKISTRSEKLSDFRIKTTMVVLGGNDFQDIALKEAVRNSWTINPYEFCSYERYLEIHGDSNYYFMMRVTDKKKKGISFLTLVKGGEGSPENKLTVFTMPVGASGATDGSEEVFLTALMGMMQENVEKGLQSSMVTLGSVKGGKERLRGMKIYFNDEDLVTDAHMGKDMFKVGREEAEDIMMSGAYNTAVSYVIAPLEPANNSLCYKMLIDVRTSELLYFEKHRIGKDNGAGFLKKDIKKLSRRRK